jgi:hypothetical protein
VPAPASPAGNRDDGVLNRSRVAAPGKPRPRGPAQAWPTWTATMPPVYVRQLTDRNPASSIIAASRGGSGNSSTDAGR